MFLKLPTCSEIAGPRVTLNDEGEARSGSVAMMERAARSIAPGPSGMSPRPGRKVVSTGSISRSEPPPATPTSLPSSSRLARISLRLVRPSLPRAVEQRNGQREVRRIGAGRVGERALVDADRQEAETRGGLDVVRRYVDVELHARVAQEERVIQGGQEVEVESMTASRVAADLGIRMELQVGQAAGQVGETAPRALSAWNRVSVSCSR